MRAEGGEGICCRSQPIAAVVEMVRPAGAAIVAIAASKSSITLVEAGESVRCVSDCAAVLAVSAAEDSLPAVAQERLLIALDSAALRICVSTNKTVIIIRRCTKGGCWQKARAYEKKNLGECEQKNKA